MARRPGKNIPEERLTAFLALYIANGFNQKQACIAMGMSENSARANAHRYATAIRSRIEMKQALAAVGLDPVRVAQKLNTLIDAETPKWNAADEGWDYFLDGHLQLEAAKEVAKMYDVYPAEKPRTEPVTVNVIFTREP